MIKKLFNNPVEMLGKNESNYSLLVSPRFKLPPRWGFHLNDAFSYDHGNPSGLGVLKCSSLYYSRAKHFDQEHTVFQKLVGLP